MITSIFSTIAGLLQLVPALKKFVEEFFKFYAEIKIKEHENDFAKALKGILEGNQIPLEEAIGSDNAGKPALRRDGVRERPRGGINEEPTIDSNIPSNTTNP
jgi:UPF0716 family protein affecting phage T7 exclusion